MWWQIGPLPKKEAPVTVAPALAPEPMGMLPLAIPEEPTEPFGVMALPDLTRPVTAHGIQRAYAAMLAHYHVAATPAQRTPDRRPIGAQLDKAHAVVTDRARWIIHPDYVEIHSDSGTVYRTRPDFCEGASRTDKRGRRTTICQGFGRAAVGCYHLIAVELLRLAQELDPPVAVLTVADDPAPTLTEIACLCIPGFALMALCGCIRIAQTKASGDDADVVLVLNPAYRTLTLSSGDYSATAPAEPLCGAYIAIPPAAFSALWAAIRPLAMETDSITLTVAIDSTNTGLLTASGGALCVAVPVQASPL